MRNCGLKAHEFYKKVNHHNSFLVYICVDLWLKLVEFPSKSPTVNSETQFQMDIIKQLFSSPFFWGFLTGFGLCILALYSHFKTKVELKRLKGHLSDKLEIEAETMGEMKTKLEGLRGENENLRLKINSSRVQNDKLDLERELEIFARAEKAMTINAPGFAQAWERAKDGAADELQEEERGKSIPRRIFRRFFTKTDALDGEIIEALPENASVNRSSSSNSNADANASETSETTGS